MTCIFAGVFAAMGWPSTLYTVCYYMCPTSDVTKKYVSVYKTYGAVCSANLLVGE